MHALATRPSSGVLTSFWSEFEPAEQTLGDATRSRKLSCRLDSMYRLGRQVDATFGRADAGDCGRNLPVRSATSASEGSICQSMLDRKNMRRREALMEMIHKKSWSRVFLGRRSGLVSSMKPT